MKMLLLLLTITFLSGTVAGVTAGFLAHLSGYDPAESITAAGAAFVSVAGLMVVVLGFAMAYLRHGRDR